MKARWRSPDRIPTVAPVQMYYDGVSMDAIWGMKSLGIDPPQRTGNLFDEKRYPDL